MAPETLLLNKSIILQSAEETIQLGAWIASSLSKPTVIFLYGDLGSGKTTFSKGFIEAMTQEDKSNITSPTFVYMNQYAGPMGQVAHFDLYRMKDKATFLAMGLDEVLHSAEFSLVEWPEIIEDLVEPAILLKFSTDQQFRKVELIGGHIE
jgi:tRNA threonylcarbamoyladenosine biosynthesis protein TsaE